VNLIDAVKTGQPFRRASDTATYGDDFWVVLKPRQDQGKLLDSPSMTVGYFDVMAEDWEVKTDEPEANVVGAA
jgi:hypothetical protein